MKGGGNETLGSINIITQNLTLNPAMEGYSAPAKEANIVDMNL